MSGGAPKIIRPPDTLSAKVSVTADGVDLEALERAEQVIANLQDNYLDWVQEDLNNIQAAYDKAIADPAGRKTHLEEVFRIAHDVKGQGGSFDYPLMTVIGNLLCRFLESIEGDAGDSALKVVKVHIDAMRLVITKHMQGDGGNAGDHLIRGLDAVLAKVGR